MDYPDDSMAWEVEDEFLFGRDILVAPITQPGQWSRSVYLPAGLRWLEVASGQVLEGGATVEVDAPIERIPVFAREGADVPVRG